MHKGPNSGTRQRIHTVAFDDSDAAVNAVRAFRMDGFHDGCFVFA